MVDEAEPLDPNPSSLIISDKKFRVLILEVRMDRLDPRDNNERKILEANAEADANDLILILYLAEPGQTVEEIIASYDPALHRRRIMIAENTPYESSQMDSGQIEKNEQIKAILKSSAPENKNYAFDHEEDSEYLNAMKTAWNLAIKQYEKDLKNSPLTERMKYHSFSELFRATSTQAIIDGVETTLVQIEAENDESYPIFAITTDYTHTSQGTLQGEIQASVQQEDSNIMERVPTDRGSSLIPEEPEEKKEEPEENLGPVPDPQKEVRASGKSLVEEEADRIEKEEEEKQKRREQETTNLPEGSEPPVTEETILPEISKDGQPQQSASGKAYHELRAKRQREASTPFGIAQENARRAELQRKRDERDATRKAEKEARDNPRPKKPTREKGKE